MQNPTLLSLTACLTLAMPLALAGAAQTPIVGAVSTAQKSNDTDVLFMEVATMSNLTEIKTSQLALQKSNTPAVKAFAQQMIDEHTKAQTELVAIAKSKGVTLTDKPGADQRLQYNKLSTLSGKPFDSFYKKVQTSGHQTTLDLIVTYRSVGKDADAQAYAAKIQPVVEMHLMDARKLPSN